jgi:hypothetical protein
MGWQKRGSGNSYNTPSGHALFIGGRTKKVVAYYVLSKICRKCLFAETPSHLLMTVHEIMRDPPKEWNHTVA